MFASSVSLTLFSTSTSHTRTFEELKMITFISSIDVNEQYEMTLKTNWFIDCMFGVTCVIIFNTSTIMSCLLGVTNAVISIAIIHFGNLLIDYLVYICTVCNDNVLKSDHINLQSTFPSNITIFNGIILDTFITLRIFFINCIMLQNGCGSYYKLIYCYYYTFTHLRLVLPSIDQLEMMTYDTVEVKKPNVKRIGYICDQNTYSCNILNCPSIDHISMMIYSLMNHLSIDKHTMTTIFRVIGYIQQTCMYKAGIKWIYIKLQAIFSIIMTLFNTLHGIFIRLIFKKVFITCIVIAFNARHCSSNSYYKLVYYCCLSFLRSIMTYLSIICELTTYVIIECIKQYKFAENKPGNDHDGTNQFTRNMKHVSIDCVLICIVISISIIHFIDPLTNDLSFKGKDIIALFYVIIIVSIFYSCVSGHYDNQATYGLQSNNAVIFVSGVCQF